MKGFTQAAAAGALALIAGFALPSATRAQARHSGARAFTFDGGSRIGATVQDIEDGDAKGVKAGVVVEAVESGGPADKAGVKAGDAITEFDGERVRGTRQFSRLVQETPSGRSVAVVLSRGGQRTTVNVTPEHGSFGDDFAMRLLEAPAIVPSPARPPRAPAPPVPPEPPLDILRFGSGRTLGVGIETLDDQLAQYFGVKEGALVRSVAADSPAQKAGLRAGDVITGINGRSVYDASDVTRAIGRTGDSDEITIEIVRDHKPQTLKAKLEPRARRSSTRS